jgi:hypothetical protein
VADDKAEDPELNGGKHPVQFLFMFLGAWTSLHFSKNLLTVASRHSVACIVWKIRSSILAEEKDFSLLQIVQDDLGHTQPPTEWVPGFIPGGVKLPRCDVNSWPRSSGEVRNWAEMYLCSACVPSRRGQRRLLPWKWSDSVVGIATHYGLDGPGIESRWRRDFPYPSRRALDSTVSPLQRVPCLFPGGKVARAWRPAPATI